MNRRNVLVGLGTLAVGSGVVFASGAFTQVSANRDVTIRIDEDSDALLGLEPNNDINAVDTDGGKLVIDSGLLGGGEGFNVDAIIQIGETDENGGAVTTGAFRVVNNFDADIDVTIDLTELEGSGTLTFYTSVEENNNSVTDGDNLTLEVGSEEEILVAIELDTDEETEDFDGEITLSAGPVEE